MLDFNSISNTKYTATPAITDAPSDTIIGSEIFFTKYWESLKEKFNLTYSLEQILEQTSKDIKDCSASTNKFSLYEYLYFNLHVVRKYRPKGKEWKYNCK